MSSEQNTQAEHATLTETYERLRHSTDEAELHEFARRPLPDRADQAAFSRATALLEAVAGNQHTPLEDRVFLAQTMPFPNVLVKLSTDEAVDVRRAVAANADAKNWLVGRLTKDGDAGVRDEALTQQADLVEDAHGRRAEPASGRGNARLSVAPRHRARTGRAGCAVVDGAAVGGAQSQRVGRDRAQAERRRERRGRARGAAAPCGG